MSVAATFAFLSPARVLNAIAAIGNFQVKRDIGYAGGKRHQLDVYMPASASGSAPVIVFLYGGGWEEGDKAIYSFVGAALAKSGFVTVIPDYRVYPEVRFPGFLRDAATAVRWAYDHAGEFGGDPSRIVLMGHSAGAHIAAMLTFERQWLAAVELDPARDLKGFVGLAGPYDFLPLHSETLKAIFGPPVQLPATQPIHFVDGTAPPAFLATGRVDTTVNPGNTTRMADRIRTHGGSVSVEIYAHVGHKTLIGAFSLPLQPLAPVLRDTVRFVRQITAEAASSHGVDHPVTEPA